MKRSLALAALIGFVCTGCETTFPREDLAVKGLLGADFNQPLGGELPMDKFGLAGSSFATEWIEPDDMPRLKGRGYTFPGEGVFDGKTLWSVEEWADRKSGRIELLVARRDITQRRLKKTSGSESVNQCGELIRQYFAQLLGPESAVRCRDLSGMMIPKPTSGPYEQNYLWIRGNQGIRLGLTYSDGAEGSDGTLTIEIQRLDALDAAVRQKVLATWGVKDVL